MSIIQDICRVIEQQAQRQDSETDQLRDLIPLANRLGMYDAADYLERLLDANPGQ